MQNIINALMIKNRGNGKGYAFAYKGKTHRSATLTELIDEIFNLPGVSYEQWHKDITNEIQKAVGYTEQKAPELFREYLTKILNEAMAEKRSIRDEYQQNGLPSAFNAEIITCKFKPANDYNDKDRELLEIFVYCEDNNVVYAEIDGNYTIVGTPLDISNRKTQASYLAGSMVKKHFSNKYCSDYQIWADMYNIADSATDTFFNYRRSIEEAISQGLNPSELKFKVNDKETNMQEFLQFPLDKFSDDWDDALHTAICKHIINDMLPASIFNNDIAQLCFESKNNMFHRYSLRPAHGKKSNLNTIISMIFEDPCVIDELRHIKTTPHIIYDTDGQYAQYKIQSDWQKNLPEQFNTAEECKGLNTFLNPFSAEEKAVMMAWSYMALHPSTGETIGLLVQTGGGTFKTGYFAEMTRYLMSVMYNAPKDHIGFMMKKDAWVENIKLREPGNRGISKAGMVIIDEAGSKSIEQYKLWSGSTVDVGIDYEYSKVYQEGVQTKIFCPWLFTSNEDLFLADDKGVYDRRLIVIKRMDLSNFPKPYDMKDYHIQIRKEAIHFYNLAKKCYDTLKDKYGSLTTAVNKIKSIHKNLTDVWSQDLKLVAYEQLYNDLQTGNSVFDEYVEVPINVFNQKIEELAKDLDLQAKGLKKFCFITDETVKPNEKNKKVWLNGKTTAVHRLYRLNDDTAANLTEQTEGKPTESAEPDTFFDQYK